MNNEIRFMVELFEQTLVGFLVTGWGGYECKDGSWKISARWSSHGHTSLIDNGKMVFTYSDEHVTNIGDIAKIVDGYACYKIGKRVQKSIFRIPATLDGYYINFPDNIDRSRVSMCKIENPYREYCKTQNNGGDHIKKSEFIKNEKLFLPMLLHQAKVYWENNKANEGREDSVIST